MGTFSSITDDVLAQLRSYVRDQELSTHLTANATASVLSLTIADPAIVSRGRIQIDDELIWVDKPDRNSSLLTVPPYGRGMDSTTAAAHTSGTRVIVQPLYPRKMVMDAINNAIKVMGTQLYGTAQTTFSPNTTSFVYALPAGMRDVLTVKVIDYLGNVNRIRDWAFDPNAPTSVAATGNALYLHDHWMYGMETIVVSYTTEPLPLVAGADNFSVTLLPSTSEDILSMIAASRLLASAEAYALQTRSIEANALDSKVQPGQALAQSKYLYQLAQQRLQEERMRLLVNTPIRSHYSR